MQKDVTKYWGIIWFSLQENSDVRANFLARKPQKCSKSYTDNKVNVLEWPSPDLSTVENLLSELERKKEETIVVSRCVSLTETNINKYLL